MKMMLLILALFSLGLKALGETSPFLPDECGEEDKGRFLGLTLSESGLTSQAQIIGSGIKDSTNFTKGDLESALRHSWVKPVGDVDKSFTFSVLITDVCGNIEDNSDNQVAFVKGTRTGPDSPTKVSEILVTSDYVKAVVEVTGEEDEWEIRVNDKASEVLLISRAQCKLGSGIYNEHFLCQADRDIGSNISFLLDITEGITPDMMNDDGTLTKQGLEALFGEPFSNIKAILWQP